MERAWIRDSHVSLYSDDVTGDHGFLKYLVVSFLIAYSLSLSDNVYDDHNYISDAFSSV
jgi:hypothetical protein